MSYLFDTKILEIDVFTKVLNTK